MTGVEGLLALLRALFEHRALQSDERARAFVAELEAQARREAQEAQDEALEVRRGQVVAAEREVAVERLEEEAMKAGREDAPRAAGNANEGEEVEFDLNNLV